MCTRCATGRVFGVSLCLSFYLAVKDLCSATLVTAIFPGARAQLVLIKTSVAVQICSVTKPVPFSGCHGDSGFRRAIF